MLQVVRFIDLGGHQKYLKTALYGLTSLLPDYVIVCICPITGLTQVTREHLAVALALELPVAFLITKVVGPVPTSGQKEGLWSTNIYIPKSLLPVAWHSDR